MTAWINICPMLMVGPAISNNGLYIHAHVLWAGIHKIKAADGIPKFNSLFDLSLCNHSEMQILTVYPMLLGNTRSCFQQSLSCNLMWAHQCWEWKLWPIYRATLINWDPSTANAPCIRDGLTRGLESNTRDHQGEECAFDFTVLIRNQRGFFLCISASCPNVPWEY